MNRGIRSVGQMATSHLPGLIFRPTLHRKCHPPTTISLTHPQLRPRKGLRSHEKLEGVVRLSMADQEISPPPTPKQETAPNLEELVDFLYKDLPHLFDDKGIDPTAYDAAVKFRDPITRHDNIRSYLLNIATLKYLFRPKFTLHWVKQTGPSEITTRWTMVMRFLLLPWQPELVFTGTSVMKVNPETKKFIKHVDYWDSIMSNEFFSIEGLFDVIQQLWFYKTPDLETPSYQILKRTASCQIRKYDPFVVVEADGDVLSGSKGFNDVAGYIFGKNSASEKIPMTTPVFTQASDDQKSEVSIQIVLPSTKSLNSLPTPNEEGLKLRKVEGGIAAVTKFSGKPTENIVLEKEKELRSSLIRNGLKPKPGCLLARYNDPDRTWEHIMRNEVLIWLEEFSLD
nr:heme-binding-like protein, chloroplastic [Ipomoea batatas]